MEHTMFKATVTAAMFAFLLTACETAPHHDANDDWGPGTDACGASGYQSLMGTNIAAITLPAELNHRIIGPNDAYTEDYVPSRLNIFTDENGVVIEVRCG